MSLCKMADLDLNKHENDSVTVGRPMLRQWELILIELALHAHFLHAISNVLILLILVIFLFQCEILGNNPCS